MCYVGKATKLFIFIFTVLLILAIVLGFRLLRHRHHNSTIDCSVSTCNNIIYPPPPLTPTQPNPVTAPAPPLLNLTPPPPTDSNPFPPSSPPPPLLQPPPPPPPPSQAVPPTSTPRSVLEMPSPEVVQ